MAVKLTEEQKQAIHDYGKEIYSAKNDMEAIRLTIGFMIGSKGNHGYLTLVREIYDNAIDQMLDKVYPCTHITVAFDERTLECTITDNGKGLPFKDMVRIYTKSHTSKNYTKTEGSGNYSIGLNGVGAKAVNALSKTFIAESYLYTGEARRLECHEGMPTTKEPVKIPNKDKKQGTKVSFIPSDILGEINVTYKEVYKLVRDIFALMPTDKTMDFVGIDMNGKVHEEHIVNRDGIMYFLVKTVKTPLIAPIEALADSGNERLHAMFTWDTGALSDPAATGESVIAYSNYCPIYDAGSTNITGTIKGIASWFCDYMNKIYLVSTRSKVHILPSDVKTGLCVAIDSDCLNPVFTGQAKEKLSNVEMDGYCKQVIMSALDNWSKANPNELAKVCKFIKDIATIRERSDKEKVKISTNYESSSFSGLPAKYVKPTGKDHLELIICEGDSAKGPIVKCRDTVHQGKMMPHIVVTQCA